MANHTPHISRLFGFCLLSLTLFMSASADPSMPYKADVDPHQSLEVATEEAQSKQKSILIVFGANWCPDCRQFALAIHDDAIASMVDEHFAVIHVDVGNWDHNLDFVEAWGNPIKGGIPAVVVATPGHEVIYKTEAGELATARQNSIDELGKALLAMAELARDTEQ